MRTRVTATATGLVLGAALVGEALAYALLIHHTDLVHSIRLVLISTPLWLLAVWLLSRCSWSPRRFALVVLGASAVLQTIAITSPPSTSDDDYRYTWDAKVQLAGVDPYRDPPSSSQLAPLRSASLFGAPAHCQYPFRGGCTSINRPTVRTIYPPVAEAAFVVLRVVSFGGQGNRFPLQLAGLLGSLLIGGLLLRFAQARGRPWLAAVWAWCPVVITEYANNAHIDWLAVLFVVLAFGTRAVRRTGFAAALVGAAIAVKLYPGLVLASLMRRHPVRAVGVALGLVAVSYVPHVFAVGTAVVGYLPGYLTEEKYGSGGRLLLLGAVLPGPIDTVVGALILLAVGVWAWRRGDPAAPYRSAVVVVGVAFLVFTPSYAWYTGVLIALVVMTGAVEWVPIAFAATGAYLSHSDHDTQIYAVAAVLVVVIAIVRRRVERRPPPSAPARASPATGPLTVSIIVPVLDEAAVIDATLARLRRDFGSCELLVVDGGSHDDTVQLAAAHATVFRTDPGRAVQMNEGARRAGGDVLWFVHADLIIEPTALDQLRTSLADPGVVGGGFTLRFDRRTPALDYLARVSTVRARRLHHVFGDQAMFVRRTAFEQLDGFADLPLMEDFEFTRRLSRAGRMVVLPATSTASARRFTRHGTVRMIAFMQYLKLLFLAGASPERIRLRYEAGPGVVLPRTKPESARAARS